MADNDITIHVKSSDNTKAGFDKAKEEAERSGDESGRGWADNFARNMLDGLGGDTFAKAFGGGNDEAGKSGGDSGGFWASRFTQTILGSKFQAITAAVGVGLAALPALGGIAGTGIGVAMIGGLAAVLLAKNAQVKSAFSSMGTQVMGTLEKTIAPIVPIVTRITSQFGGLIKSVGPELTGIFKTIGPSLEPLFHQVAGIVTGLVGVMKAAAPAFGPFISALLSLVRNVLPPLAAGIKATVPFIGEFGKTLGTLGSDLGSLFGSLGPAIKASMTVLDDLLRVVGGLLPVLMKLGGTLAQLLAPVFVQLAGVVHALMPSLVMLGRLLGQLAGAVLANLAGGLAAIAGLLRAVAPAFGLLTRSIGQAFTLMENRGVLNDLEDAIEGLVGPIGKLATALITGLAPLLPPVIALAGELAGTLQGALITAVTALTPVAIELVNDALKPLLPVITALVPVVRVVAQVLGAGLAASLNVIAPVLARLAPVILAIVGAVKLWSIAQAVLDAVMDANPIVLIGIAIVALTGIIVELVKHWKDVENVFAAGFDLLKKGVADFVDFFEAHWKLLATIIATVLLGPIGGLIAYVATHWSQFRQLTSSLISDVTGFFDRLPGDILHALASLPGQLLSFGRSIVDGLLRGIEDAAGGLLAEVGHLASDVGHAFASVLHIGSPSKVFEQHGRDIVQGLINGINGASSGATSAMRKLGLSGLPGSAGGLATAGGSRTELVVTGAGSANWLALVKAIWPDLRLEVRSVGGGGPYSVQRALGRTWPQGA